MPIPTSPKHPTPLHLQQPPKSGLGHHSPPKKSCAKTQRGAGPPLITDLLCQEQWHRLGSLVIYDAKNCFKYQRKQNKRPKKLGYPLPTPPFPMEIQRRKKTLSKALSGLGNQSRKGKRSTAHSSQKVTLGAPCSSSQTCYRTSCKCH